MNILYVDLDKHTAEEVLLMIEQIKGAFSKDMPLLVVPKDCRFVEDAPYEDLMNIKMIVDKALEERENDLPSE